MPGWLREIIVEVVRDVIHAELAKHGLSVPAASPSKP
jgi:hypothetical protein